jgi:peptide/nickel transport system substrate-binding protein
MHSTTRVVTAVGALTAAALTLAGCAGGNSAPTTQDTLLTIDSGFTIETGDPGHTYDPTGNMLAKALYETLVDFDGADISTPVPGLASWEQNDDATEFTFTIEDGRTFTDGSPVEAKDVVFSLERIQSLPEAKPNFLLAGITIDEVDDMTVSFSTESPSLQLPAILANPALGILNSDVVMEHGGSVDGDDSAQEWLDANSAGSGPYVLDSLDLTSQIVLTGNDEYTGPETVARSAIVPPTSAVEGAMVTTVGAGARVVSCSSPHAPV